jgi:hypothetical protein
LVIWLSRSAVQSSSFSLPALRLRVFALNTSGLTNWPPADAGGFDLAAFALNTSGLSNWSGFRLRRWRGSHHRKRNYFRGMVQSGIMYQEA